MLSVKCRLWSEECGVCGVKCRSVECGVVTVKCKVWSGVWSGVWGVYCEM